MHFDPDSSCLIFSLIPSSSLLVVSFRLKDSSDLPFCRLHQPAAQKKPTNKPHDSTLHLGTRTHIGTKQVTIYACHEFAEGEIGVFVIVCVCAWVDGWMGGAVVLMCVLVHLMFPALSEAISSLTHILAQAQKQR